MDNDIERVKQLLGGYNHDPEHADMHASLDRIITYAGRYRWLREYAVSAGLKMPRCPTPCPDGIATCTTRHTLEVSGRALDEAIDAAMAGANT